MRLAAALFVVLGVGLASAAPIPTFDVTGTYGGQLEVTRPRQVATSSGTLSQAGRTVTGMVTVTTSLPALNGSYDVRGTVRGTHVRLAGPGATGAHLVWRATISATGLAGPARLHAPGAHAAGRLALDRAPTGNVANCDAVFTQNQTFFVGQVMGEVLEPVCAACHAAGGQAQATRLRVTPADPLATARSTALLVDPTTPASSRLLQKPLALVAHGGGQQLQPGSAQEQVLRQWVDLLAQSHCTAGGGGTGNTGADLYVANCASCHGGDAAGGAGFPDVRCTVRSRVFDAVRAGRGNGRAMPSFGPADLSNAAVTQIVGYLAGLCTGRPADVYASNCATCHGPTGTGGRNADGVRGSNIRCSGGGELVDAVRSGGEGMPAFELSSARVQGLATFLRGGPCGGGD
jgi:mono/diheme cytochrome c family protein